MADELFAVVASGKVQILIEQRYALKDVAQAHRDLEAPQQRAAACCCLTGLLGAAHPAQFVEDHSRRRP